MDIFQWYELSRSRSGTAFIPLKNAVNTYFVFSTRVGDAVVDKGDGSSPYPYTTGKMLDFTVDSRSGRGVNLLYSSAFTGNASVKFLNGLRDVYSFASSHNSPSDSKYNITDIETFFKQFPNLYSVFIDEYVYQTPANMAVIKGDLSRFPDSVERVLLGSLEILNVVTDLVLNFSNYTNTSKLKSFHIQASFGSYAPKVMGDLGKLPVGCIFLNLQKASAGSSITYTAGKVWASAFDTLYLPIPLTYYENDALLNDLKNSVTSATGGKVIYLGGGYRTSASDAAVTYLTGLGFTILGVSVIITLKILDLDFQNNFTDNSSSALTMVAGGTSNQPTFALSGRKAGEYCAVFNGSQSIKTTTNLPINSDKVTVAFWMKPTANGTQILFELSNNAGSNNAFYIDYGEIASKIVVKDRNTLENIKQANTSVATSTWNHIAVVIDRSQNGSTDITIYINNVLQSLTTLYSSNNDINGTFLNNILFIGQRAGNTLGFNGSLTKLKIYNYPFTPSEVSTLYNSEL